MQEPIETSSRHWAAKSIQRNDGSLMAQGISRRGSSTWVRKGWIIGGIYHGGALALRGGRRPKKHFSFLHRTYHGLQRRGHISVRCRLRLHLCTIHSSYVGAASAVPWFGWARGACLFSILTLSCPMWRFCGVLTLAVYISPNNGPIDLLLGEEMILHVMAIIFLIRSK